MIYLDNAATTRITEPVLEAMMPWLTSEFSNPSSAYRFARRAAEAVARAREQCAALIGAGPEEIIFTGGGSESDNQALRSVLEMPGKNHVITTRIEHPAVLRTCEYLEKKGVSVTYLAPDQYGVISPEAVESSIRGDTAMVSVMTANNEIGTLEPIGAIGEICRKHGVLFHTDAVQACGHIPLDVREMKIDLLSASAHKLHGPKGAGMLFIRDGLRVPPLVYGGGQENGLRAGTLNTAGIAGFGAAAEEAGKKLSFGIETAEGAEPEAIRRMKVLRDDFIRRVLEKIPGSRLNGHPVERLPGNIHMSFDGVNGKELLFLMDQKGVCASTGSACSAASGEPSHVLLAAGLSRERAEGSLRLTLSWENTKEEMDETLEILREAVMALRVFG